MENNKVALEAAVKAAQKVLIKHFKYGDEQHFLITVHNHDQSLFHDGSVDANEKDKQTQS